MKRLDENGKALQTRWNALMSGRPLWVSLLVHTAFTGAAFGLIYLVMQLLTGRWWLAPIAIVASGLTWGVSAHRKRSKSEPNSDPSTESDEPG
jgi:hypothetical protein